MKNYKVTMTGTFVAVAEVKAKDETLARELAVAICADSKLRDLGGAEIDKTEVEIVEGGKDSDRMRQETKHG